MIPTKPGYCSVQWKGTEKWFVGEVRTDGRVAFPGSFGLCLPLCTDNGLEFGCELFPGPAEPKDDVTRMRLAIWDALATLRDYQVKACQDVPGNDYWGTRFLAAFDGLGDAIDMPPLRHKWRPESEKEE